MKHDIYILYDERAMYQDTDDCSILCTAQTYKEAMRDAKEMGYNSVIYGYRFNNKNEAVDETFIKFYQDK